MTKKDLKETALKKEVGLRFKQFREFIKKSRAELSGELKITKGIISFIETGQSVPGFNVQDYLNSRYHLNINWLLQGSGEMIQEPVINPKHLDLHQILSQINENDPMYEKYVELFRLLLDPDIAMILFGKLAEIKVISRKGLDKRNTTNDTNQKANNRENFII